MLALLGSVAEEIHGPAFEVFGVRVALDDVGTYFPYRLESPVIYGSIHFHPAGV